MQHNADQYTVSGIPRTPIRFLLYVTKPYRWWAVLALVAVTVAGIISQGSLLLFQFIIDGSQVGDLRKVMVFALLYPALIYLNQVIWRASGFFGMKWSVGVEATAGEELTGHLYGHSHTYFSNRFAGALLSKINNVVDGVRHLIPEILWTILSSFVAFLVSFVLIFRVDAQTGLLFFALLLVLFVVNKRLAPRKRLLSKTSAQMSTTLRGFTVDVLTNMAAVRQYATVEDEFERTKEHIGNRKKAGGKSWLYTEIMMLINSTILFLFMAAMLYVLVFRWSTGLITTGELVLVLSLVANISGTLIFIGRAFNSVAESVGQIDEGLKEILHPHEIVDVPTAKDLIPVGGGISFDSVSFEYKERPVFENLSFVVEPGQKIGLVGPSGAGKTTLVSLLLRQHDLKAGSISIDGQDISEVTQDSLRRTISVVPQDPALFHRTIRENIAYGKPDATDEEVIRVAKMAEAHDFISVLPQGYDTLVGERGVKLSGGQRQRVAIARAMLKDAPILILDEATSSLDSESEVAIQKALHVLMEGKTVVAIAHRLSTLREMDRIVVLEDGVVVEDGSHGDLVTRKGTYARLWEHQAGGFLQE